MENMTDWVSIDEAAALCGGVNPETVRGWLRAGKLKGYKIGVLWKIKRADLEAFIAASSNQPAKEPQDVAA